MKEIGLHIKIHFYEMEELPKEERELVESAIAATDHAYAKYSNFRVGAAIRLSDGSVMIGANQENAAFPSGLCAERTAIFAAQAQYPEKAITMLAVAARNENGLLKCCSMGLMVFMSSIRRKTWCRSLSSAKT